jgi:hypothetical protein
MFRNLSILTITLLASLAGKAQQSSAIVTESQEPVLIYYHGVTIECDEENTFPVRNYLRTNIVEDALAIPNITWELDLSTRTSIAVTTGLSYWNYIHGDIKLREYKLMPEFRYWFNQSRRWHVEAHLGLIYFNFATGGEYRYQDKNGTHPALGGGVGVGYRLDLGKSPLALEFGVGVGVYNVRYDKFKNYYQGPLVSTHHITYVGLDRFNISLVYKFKPFGARCKQ